MNKKHAILLLTSFFVIVLTFTGVSAAANSIKLIVNGNTISTDVPPQNINSRVMVPVRWVTEALGAKVTWNAAEQSVSVDLPAQQSQQQQINLLRSWIAAKTSEEAVQTWANAVKMRNGAVQFALLSPKLQEQTQKSYEKMGWVTGVSSPWVDKYVISDGAASADGTSTYQVTFTTATSTGIAGSGTVKVSVENVNDNWAISGITTVSGPDVIDSIIPSQS